MSLGVQGLLRALFMRTEHGLNRAVGDRLNPFYHLGTIAFWQFWLVIISGLYLYIFSETGVHVAYESVERITHQQWWLGGVLRSVHRYATDGMILAMGLHLLRHFAFDRHRGFRAFSWITGGIVLWLVYAAGINGFMLVWDKLAQFVVVATAEWFDVLPLFNGTLIRNFITPESVSDRLFTLLAFMHIGIPLFVGLLLWVHVQRVPQARINPPRAITIALTLSLLALALVRPVWSQGGEANLSQAQATLALDWFQLAVLPLVYAIDPRLLWALVLVASGLLFLAPWLPTRRRADGALSYRINLQPGGQSIVVRADETLLDAGLRQGLDLPYECRNGACGLCKCTVLHGQVAPGVYQPGALSEAERAQGQVLMCCAVALEDVDIHCETSGMTAPVREHRARVAHMEKLCHDVMHVVLAPSDGQAIHFKAGQYINIVLDDGQRRAFSFANPPHEGGHIDLHIRRVAGGRFTTAVFETLRVGDTLRWEGPLGDFVLTESTRPIVFVAGATGFAPVKSMVEDAFQRGLQRPIYLYWGVRELADLYLPELPRGWASARANFHFIPVLSQAAPTDHWTGRTGLVREAILEDFPDLKGHEIYACGSVGMIEALFPSLKTQGAEEGMCFSDAFTLSARSLALQPERTRNELS